MQPWEWLGGFPMYAFLCKLDFGTNVNVYLLKNTPKSHNEDENSPKSVNE